MKKFVRSPGFFVVVALVVLVSASQVMSRGSQSNQLNLNDFRAKLTAGQITKAEIKDRSNVVTGEYVEAGDKTPKKFKVSYPSRYLLDHHQRTD